MTEYQTAWEKFKRTTEYKNLRGGIPIADPYLENRFRVAFDAGWNSKTSAILEAIKAKLYSLRGQPEDKPKGNK